MKGQDYSQIIYDKFYSADKLLKITLKNGNILEGKLVGFYHGDPYSDEPFVIRWHYVGTGEDKLVPVGNGNQGVILEQADIKNVEFK